MASWAQRLSRVIVGTLVVSRGSLFCGARRGKGERSRRNASAGSQERRGGTRDASRVRIRRVCAVMRHRCVSRHRAGRGRGSGRGSGYPNAILTLS